MVDFSTREGIMKEWDKWAEYHKSGGGGSWPRDAFESLLDYLEERKSECDHVWYEMDGYKYCFKCKTGFSSG